MRMVYFKQSFDNKKIFNIMESHFPTHKKINDFDSIVFT